MSGSLASTAASAWSLTSGFGRLTRINTSVRRSATPSSDSITTRSNSEPLLPSPCAQSTLTPEQQSQRDLEEDRKDAERELQRYEETGLPGAVTECTTHIVSYWELKERIFPLLFRVAMDVLPAQASSVPSERVFSSSKETCTLRRANLSSPVLEALQVLKFSYKQDCLNFTSDLIAEEADYNISGPVSRKAIDELMSAGKLDELAELLTNENEDQTS